MNSDDDPLQDLPDGAFDREIANYYDLLAVNRNVSQSEIHDAYKRKIQKYHPDTSDHSYAEDITFALNQARDVLLNENNRLQYNELGHRQYYSQEITKVSADTPNMSTDQETNFVDLIRLAKVDNYTTEPWWKTIIKSTGFKILLVVFIFLIALAAGVSLVV